MHHIVQMLLRRSMFCSSSMFLTSSTFVSSSVSHYYTSRSSRREALSFSKSIFLFFSISYPLGRVLLPNNSYKLHKEPLRREVYSSKVEGTASTAKCL